MKLLSSLLALFFLVACVQQGTQVDDGFHAGIPDDQLLPPGPSITLVTLPNNHTYIAADNLTFKVRWQENILVFGSPKLRLVIGGGEKFATYVGGSGTNELTFNYLVSNTDNDLGGIILSSPVNLNGGTIKNLAGSPASLNFSAQDTSGILVDGGVPEITSITLPTNGVYETIDDLDFSINFNRTVNVNTASGIPFIVLNIGGTNRNATYLSGSGTASLVFKYSISSSDSDFDGINLNSSITLNGGTINSATGVPSNTSLPSSDTSHLLINSTTPSITSVVLPANGTYIEGQTQSFTVNFNRAVNVTGNPLLSLTIGSSSRTANYTSGSGTTALVFSYTIVSGDTDTDGIALNSPLNLNGGTIKSLFGVNSALTFTSPNSSSILVDGLPAIISSITAPNNGTYAVGQQLNFSVNYDRNVVVTGTPQLALTVGSTIVYPQYVSGSNSNSLIFRYTVVSGDLDVDGITLASPLDLNSGTIKSSSGNESILTFATPSMTSVFIDAIFTNISSIAYPANGTYKNGANLDFSFTFNRSMSVVTTSGTPRVPVVIGSTTRYATYISGSGSSTLVFRYTISSSDYDTDGVELQSPLELNSGTIRSSAGNDATLTFTPSATTSVLADGVAPSISSITLPSSSTYKIGDQLNFTYNFNRDINVTGSPRINITVGNSNKYATYVSGSGSSSLVFRYTVNSGESDNDGITLITPLELNSGSLKSTAGNDADLSYTIPNTSSILVDGIIPSISSVTASPNGTYYNGQDIDLSVTFSQIVAFNTSGGSPRIALTVGSATKYAYYNSGSGTSSAIFRYSVGASDIDSDGITMSSPIDLNGGTIKSSAGNDSALTFTAPTTTGVLVGGTQPSISSITAPSNGNYDRTSSSNISFVVNYSQAMTVTGTPRLTLDVGGTTKYATYASGSGTTALTFTYTVSSTDLDMDGISVSSPIDLNSGTIKNSTGSAGLLTFTAPSLTKVYVVYPGMVVWFDPKDTSTLFQDSGCTTAVTADNDPVGCLKDKSGKTHHALQSTASLRPVIKASGIQGHQSLLFDGSNDIISATDHADFNSLSGLTAIIVILPSTVDSNPRALISKRSSTSSVTFSLFLYSNRYLSYDISNTSNRYSSASQFNANNDYLVAMHFDGSLAQASRTKIYIDGTLNQTSQSTAATAGASTGDFHIGALNAAYSNYYHGYIGEVIFFKRSLDTSANNELVKIQQYLQNKWNI